jgi:NAD(P)-dependent dehydrogenase (short-subunit alcohol dehydrogenase family)
MTATFNLRDQVAVVTGAAGKLGPIWILALLDAGARVVGVERPGAEIGDPLRALMQTISVDRLRVDFCDITEREQIEDCASRVESQWERATMLVNNAGIDQPPADGGPRYAIDRHPVELFRRIVDVNLVGTFQATQVFGGRMAEAGGGSIVNIGSVYASVSPDQRLYSHLSGTPPFLKTPAYGASKAGVVSLTKYFAALWARNGVRVNTLSPGGVMGGQDAEFKRKYSDKVPMGRMATPDDLGGPLIFLASQAASYVTGTELIVDGGFSAW